MDTPGRLTIDKDGKLRGPANITYNDPWPLAFAQAGVTGNMDGVLLHTMVGSIESCINTFNSPNARGSAHIGIGQDGRIHQFVPFGQGYETYHAFAANKSWYGIETEDNGNPSTPISEVALWAWAQCFECLSAFATFPLQMTDDCNGHGLAYHRMCHEWNLSGHTCPGATMTDMVRVNQRIAIVGRAHMIRSGYQPPLPSGPYSADGVVTMAALAHRQRDNVAELWYETARNRPLGFGMLELSYLNNGRWNDPMPTGMIVYLP